VPRREARLRLASLWPLLIGLRDARAASAGENLLDPTVTVKVPRGEVRWLLLRSLGLVWSDRRLDAWIRRLAAAAQR
jgi:farnesyl-diphosphate farnesyltransferase